METEHAQQQRRRRAIKIALGVVVLLLALGGERLWLANHREVIAKDGILYVELAREIPGGALQAMREVRVIHPGYSLATAASHAVLGGEGRASWERAATLVSFEMSLLAALGVWVLATQLIGSPQIGWVAALLFGLGHKVALLGADVGSDAMSLAFQVWSLVAVLKTADAMSDGRRRSAAWALLAGVLAGLGYLVRPEATVVLLVALALWFVMALRRRVPARASAACMGASVVGWLACAVPYMLAVGTVFGKWRPGYFDIAGTGGTLPLACIALAENVFAATGEVVAKFFEAQHPALAAMTCLYVLAWLLGRSPKLQPWRDCLPRPSGRAAFVIVATLAMSLPVIVLRQMLTAEISSRYLLLSAAVTAVLPAALLSGAGKLAATLVDMREARTRVFWGATGALAVALTAHAMRPLHSGDVYLRDAGLAIAAIADEGDRLFTDSPYVLYYSQLEGQYRPRQDDGMFKRSGGHCLPGEFKQVRNHRATFVAFHGRADSEQLAADSESMLQAGYDMWREFSRQSREPGKPGGRVLRIWRVSR